MFTNGTLLHRLLIADGQIIDRGRTLRLASPDLRDAMVVRDHGCRFPHCDAPTAWIHAHHLQHWEEGGTTDLANLDDCPEPNDHDTALLVRARILDLVHRHHRRRRHPHRPPSGLDSGLDDG